MKFIICICTVLLFSNQVLAKVSCDDLNLDGKSYLAQFPDQAGNSVGISFSEVDTEDAANDTLIGNISDAIKAPVSSLFSLTADSEDGFNGFEFVALSNLNREGRCYISWYNPEIKDSQLTQVISSEENVILLGGDFESEVVLILTLK